MRRSNILQYIFLGIAFLLWENFISAILGIYAIEVRRTIWGLIYYPTVFLIFGCLAQTLTYIITSALPKTRYNGQIYLWFIVILVSILWWGPYKDIITDITSGGFQRVGFLLTLLWFPLLILLGIWANIIVARFGKPDDPWRNKKRIMLLGAILLYLLISGKIANRYFLDDVISFTFIAYQPFLFLLAYFFIRIAGRIFPPGRTFRGAAVIAPIVLTLLVGPLRHIIGRGEVPAIPPTQRKAVTHPNIIILLYDALRADQVGRIVDGKSLTPNLDSLVTVGRKYDKCYSSSSYTFPVVSSLLTSTLPNKLGLMDPQQIPPDLPTFTKLLSRNGYATVALSANDLFSEDYGFAAFFDRFKNPKGVGPLQLLYPYDVSFLPVKFLQEGAYQMGFIRVNSVSEDWEGMNREIIRQLADLRDQPFFLYAHYLEPHAPYYSQPFTGLVNTRMLYNPLEWYFCKKDASAEEKAAIIGRSIEVHHDRYIRSVRCIDRAAGEIFAVLKQSGLDENTIIIVTADHGEEFAEHGGWDHWTTLFEESVRVPMIVYIPETSGINLPEHPGEISLLDLGPTILDMAEAGDPSFETDGISWLQEGNDVDRSIFMVIRKADALKGAHRKGDYKLILYDYHFSDRIDTLLFNLRDDPLETRNIFTEERVIADSLAARLMIELNQSAVEGRQRELNPREVKRLRALGYID